ncbi:MAG: alpha/beta hydrolase [Thermoleophilaceae bacterium]|nr:alpha/beta hydrolase [Thermoleophilaceae bacterium]
MIGSVTLDSAEALLVDGGVRHSLVQTDRVAVHVAEAGSGEPVILLHGWPQHWWEWRHVIPPLAEHYRVICPDLRGFGWSAAPRDGYEKEGLAADLIALLDALRLERVRIAGHDWGGFVAFLAALCAPQRFSHLLALGVIHPWLDPGALSPIGIAAVLGYQGPLITPLVGTAVQRHGPFISWLMRISREGDWEPEVLAAYSDRLRVPARARASVALYRTFVARELRPLLAGRYRDRRLEIPSRLIVGKRDPVIGRGLEGFERFAPRMSLERLPEVGHWLPEEVPDLVADAALELFSRTA